MVAIDAALVLVLVVAYLGLAVLTAKLLRWLDEKYGPPEWSRATLGFMGLLWPVALVFVAVFGLCCFVGHLAGKETLTNGD